MLVFVLSAPAAPVDRDRSYVSGSYFLSLDGAQCGFLRSVDGGAISAEVINEPASPSYFTKKHIGQPKYEDVALRLGFSMTSDIYNWISDAWAMKPTRRNCLLTSLDFTLNAKDAVQFEQSLITETTIPACDGSSKEPAHLSLTLAPEYTHAAPPATVTTQLGKNEQKAWLPSNFVLAIDGLDCSRVSKVDSFTVKQAVVTDDIGDPRGHAKEPGKLEFPNLRISFSEATLQTWKAWFDDFVITGNNDESKEKSGTLTFLSPNGKDQLMTIKLHNLGIIKLEEDKAEAGSDRIVRWAAELYCERMELVKIGPGTATGTSASTEPAKTEPAPPKGLRSVDTNPVTRRLATKGALDSALTETRKFGTNPQFNFTLSGVEYTVTRQYVNTSPVEPDAKTKLMLIRYRIENPSERAMNVSPAMLRFQITDSAGANHDIQDVVVGSNNQRLGGSITPGQSIDCCAIARVPGNVDAQTLTVTCSNDAQQYNVAGKAVIREEFARDASAGPAAGYTALSEVSIGSGVFYPMMSLDYRLDDIGLGERPKVNGQARINTRCLIVTFAVRNPSTTNISFGSATCKAMLTMSDGSTTNWQGSPLSSVQDTPISAELTPGQELKMRVFFDVPVSETVTPASFRFSQGRGRVYIAELQQVRQPVRRGA
jgi:hypothetical protein